jgi:glycosyltransferase involved in cell wall biosynthesis
VRTVLFQRKFRRFHGGHLKVWHYFNHVLATPDWDARVLFDVDSNWDRSNPWSAAKDHVVELGDTRIYDAIFVAGRDWQRLDALGLLDHGLPILNLIQHVRHTDDWSIQSRYLERKAIRICVSDEVAEAVKVAGSSGPLVVIPNGIDVSSENGAPTERTTDLLIAGLKQPVMARRAGERLQAPNLTIEVLTDTVPREAFLDAMRRARVTLFLPNDEEGFYLPGLEGMALGTIVVCPDCVGNRAYCLPGTNAFRPAYDFEALIAATESALDLSPEDAQQLMARANETVQIYSPENERVAFQRVLTNLDELWDAECTS